jgi:hypothetical protein
MSKNIEDKEDKGWAIQLGLYTGILFGVRTYEMQDCTCHVFYLPFVDVALIIDK